MLEPKEHGVRKHLRSGSIGLLDITVDESSDVERSSVDLVLSLGDVQLSEKLLQDLDGLAVFRLLGRRSGGCGCHFVRL